MILPAFAGLQGQRGDPLLGDLHEDGIIGDQIGMLHQLCIRQVLLIPYAKKWLLMARGLGGPIVKAATRCLYRIEVLETTLNSQGEGGGTGIFVRLLRRVGKLGYFDVATSSNDAAASSGPPPRKRQRRKQRLRSRNNYIDQGLEQEDGTDSYADLEGFVVA